MNPAALSADWPTRFGIRYPRPPFLLRGVGDLDRTSQPVGQAHAFRRAFENLRLDGIWCPRSGPVTYFKIVSRVESQVLADLHRLVWNQGLAPLLVVIGPREVRIYSGLSTPAPSGRLDEHERGLVESLDLAADALELSRFALKVETGELFREHAEAFDPELRVDRRLLENLKAARDQLRNVSPQSNDTQDLLRRTLDALLCRIVFTCYLVDRGIIDHQYFEQAGAAGVTRLGDLFELQPHLLRRRLYSLFSLLQRDFNGDLFDADLAEEERRIGDAHLEVLGRLLRGEDLATGQLSFLDYDFGVIPIETISAIYEHFLTGQRQTGAFFTPRILAEAILNLSVQNSELHPKGRFLDPACGSGIFLVALFNRLAESWRRRNPNARYDERADALISILKDSIFGIDSDETACRIAAFSLYLAVLDHLDPPDIRKLQRRGRLLPPLVFRIEEAHEHHEWTILHASFGQADPVLPVEGFDLIVGNPPWVSRGAASGEHYEDRTAREWPHDAGVQIAQRQLAYRFIQKAPRHLKDGGGVCFLLPYGILFNHSQKALHYQRQWLRNHTVERIFNLCDLRYLLFEGAVRPALVVCYHSGPDEIGSARRQPQYTVEYYTPKADWTILQADVLSITEEDRTLVDLRKPLQMLGKGVAPTVWKERLWGTPRDWRLLDRLSLLPTLGKITGQPHKGEHKRWTIGQGFKPEKPKKRNGTPRAEPKPRTWLDTQLYVEGRSRAIDLLLTEEDCSPLGNRFLKLHRDPKASEIYEPPHVLVTQGLRIAYCDFHVVFQHALQGIHGPSDDRDLLMFLAAYLRSPLARYYLFHTVANWGVERDKIHLEELLRVPFPLPEATDNPEEARSIVRDVASRMRYGLEGLQSFSADRPSAMDRLFEEILPLIYRYYDIDDLEKILIEDTIDVSIPSKMPKRRQRQPPPALQLSTPGQRAEYLSTLCGLINEWAAVGQYRVQGELTVSRTVGLGVVALTRVSSTAFPPPNGGESRSTETLDSILERIRQLQSWRRGAILPEREFKVFDDSKLYWLKPLTFRFWTKTTALNDADEIASAILTSRPRKAE